MRSASRKLRLLLWSAWNPLGSVPRDAYDGYLPELWALLKSHAETLGMSEERYAALSRAERDAYRERVRESEERVATQLAEWRTGAMSLPPDPVTDATVAKMLTDRLRPLTTS